jgi:hypothetical protein
VDIVLGIEHRREKLAQKTLMAWVPRPTAYNPDQRPPIWTNQKGK